MDFLLCRRIREHVSLKGMKIMEIDEKKYILTYCNFKILVYNLDKSLFCGNSDDAGVMEKCTGNRTILVDDVH